LISHNFDTISQIRGYTVGRHLHLYPHPRLRSPEMCSLEGWYTSVYSMSATCTMLPKASANSMRVVWTKSRAFTPGIFRSPIACCGRITSYPFSAACLAVVETQTCAIYPHSTTLFFPVLLRYSSRSVLVKEPGNCLPITFSPAFGVSSENSSAREVPGVNTGAPSGVRCTMWTRGADAERYFSRS
jgi:hypothetical protein